MSKEKGERFTYSGDEGGEGDKYVRIKFSGDSGDGIQLLGGGMLHSSEVIGNDLSTYPDYPAEIRAPSGSLYGVSSYALIIGSREVLSFDGDNDVLVTFNPAALKTSIKTLRKGGYLIVDSSTFTERNLEKAGYKTNPLQDGSLQDYKVEVIDISIRVLSVAVGVGRRQSLQCKNMWVLGLVLWLYGRNWSDVEGWLRGRLGKRGEGIVGANLASLRDGHIYGEVKELVSLRRSEVRGAEFPRGEYRVISGYEGIGMGLRVASELSGIDIFFASYPITPASPLLSYMSQTDTDIGSKIKVFQAEDEISSICSAIGASYGGSVGVTSSSGPGIALKTEAIGLAVSYELPLLIINTQRAGPSTGMPTKTEQADLWQAIFGRNGDTYVPVIGISNYRDSFFCVIQSLRIAMRYMTPVILLSDAFITNTSGVWRLPDITHKEYSFDFLDEVLGREEGGVDKENSEEDGGQDQRADIFIRNASTLARKWYLPGERGYAYRLSSLEKDMQSGDISYEGSNHSKMTSLRREKVRGIRNFIGRQELESGEGSGDIVVVSWGSAWGSVTMAVRKLQREGYDIAQVHLRYLYPFPYNLRELLSKYVRVLVVEMNSGQLALLLEGYLRREVDRLNKVQGQPFKVEEVECIIRDITKGREGGEIIKRWI